MKIPTAILRKMTQLAYAGSSRYAMEGVHCVRKGCDSAIEVTDGAMLLRVEWKDKPRKRDFEVTLNATDVHRAKVDGDYVELREVGIPRLNGQEIRTVDKKFVETVEILREVSDECMTLSCDPVRFAKLLSTASAMTELGEKPRMEIVFPKNPLKPVRMTLVNENDSSVVCALAQIDTQRDNARDG